MDSALVGIPVALILAIAIADLAAPDRIHLGPLLVAAPAITASFAGPRLTAAIVVVSAAAELLIASVQGDFGTQTFVGEIAALVTVGVLIVIFAYVRDRERRTLTQVRSVAETAQRALLRPVPARMARLRVASTYLAAEAEAHIGGDLYGAVRTRGLTRLIIGDVRGKGLAAVSDAALLLGAFREAAHHAPTLPHLAAYLQDSYGDRLADIPAPPPEETESFITATLVEFPDDRPLLTVVTCGHPPPLLLRGGEVTALPDDAQAPPFGLGDLAPAEYTARTFPFGEGDALLLYTDGVIEARDRAGRFYPLSERIAEWAGDEPELLLRRLSQDLLRHVGGRLDDDAAMVAVRAV
ncbi:serine phosphatase RsbU (regulator of sigma subunit) [Thermocatellispora tengchongensis]|uniref:Serine phosphatase RsbU (Regulator of sigma subunit) n=1 Tax=Thermocatellispora tengchongensis TaxID=1073253 RepID=A0A840P3A6_9ACTN|nr:PP2C family protein-serine/threonine phosphatase [Thermocatellispora tengchongensis]MBB5135774.1 serine phosphatase RsbU (regulator of sigma subunit) [Thermocatellispora tengchongensis]